ncbi:PREDICTED: uncharacterized protein LOC109239725 [Nicotiana attenuata]|uniref:uncharacterized protein LOC109239725 n=1 Tax=Nicotiana attenuata TaxID=49451 RepID=UPI000904FA0C|nr:PREDICTED: uncharacterized protein LOC109239725 [Nicotiana attenuata]
MDFVVGLPQTLKIFDAVWVIVDRLTKYAHFIPVVTTYSSEWLAQIYIRDIVRLHGVPISTISDQGTQFTLEFWRAVQRELLLGADLVRDTLEKVKLFQDWLRTTQSRQKSYADRKVRDVAYMVGEKVLLRVSPMKGVMRFGRKGKLIPRYIGPFEVLARVGEVAYKLALPPSLSRIHLVFHVCMLRKYYSDPSHVLDFSTIEIGLRFGLKELLQLQVWCNRTCMVLAAGAAEAYLTGGRNVRGKFHNCELACAGS